VNWLAKRSLVLVGVAIAFGVASALIWPGDLNDEPMTWSHWVAVGGFLLTAVLLVSAAAMVLIAVTGASWSVKGFDLNEYLEDMKKDR
jgi:RsiW-degrading membrane proteinase PrsW (M82 family)